MTRDNHWRGIFLFGLASSAIAIINIRTYGWANTRLKYVLTSWGMAILGASLILAGFYHG